MKRKIGFIICGAQKAGTSALVAYLEEHPLLCMADVKEVHYFDNDEYFMSDAPDYSIYHSSFTHADEHLLLGESTPIYMYWYDSPRRIWQYNPDMKLIVILRNPIERAYSHWNMEYSKNKDKLLFWDALNNEQKRCRIALPYQHRVYSYVDRGYYLDQLRRLWTYFPKEHLLVLKNEDLRHEPNKTLQVVCDFLEIDDGPFLSVKPKDVHVRQYQSVMSEREKEYLRDIFEQEIINLERVLGWDCSSWLVE